MGVLSNSFETRLLLPTVLRQYHTFVRERIHRDILAIRKSFDAHRTSFATISHCHFTLILCGHDSLQISYRDVKWKV